MQDPEFKLQYHHIHTKMVKMVNFMLCVLYPTKNLFLFSFQEYALNMCFVGHQPAPFSLNFIWVSRKGVYEEC
jgi:hypothetical protein